MSTGLLPIIERIQTAEVTSTVSGTLVNSSEVSLDGGSIMASNPLDQRDVDRSVNLVQVPMYTSVVQVRPIAISDGACGVLTTEKLSVPSVVPPNDDVPPNAEVLFKEIGVAATVSWKKNTTLSSKERRIRTKYGAVLETVNSKGGHASEEDLTIATQNTNGLNGSTTKTARKMVEGHVLTLDKESHELTGESVVDDISSGYCADKIKIRIPVVTPGYSRTETQSDIFVSGGVPESMELAAASNTTIITTITAATTKNTVATYTAAVASTAHVLVISTPSFDEFWESDTSLSVEGMRERASKQVNITANAPPELIPSHVCKESDVVMCDYDESGLYGSPKIIPGVAKRVPGVHIKDMHVCQNDLKKTQQLQDTLAVLKIVSIFSCLYLYFLLSYL